MSDYSKYAKGQECQVRIPGVCNFNSETTVHAHLPMAGISGMGMKCPSIIGTWACSSCHDVIDGRVIPKSFTSNLSVFEQNCYAYDGLRRTLNELVKLGVI